MQTALNTQAAGETSKWHTTREAYILAEDHDCDGIFTHIKRVMVPTELSLESEDALKAAKDDAGDWLRTFEWSECMLISHDTFYARLAHKIDRRRKFWQTNGFAVLKGKQFPW